MLRWLWAPRLLISFEQGQTVVTGTVTPTMKSVFCPLFSPAKRQTYSMRLLAPDAAPFLYEIRKLESPYGRFGVEFLLNLFQDRAEGLDVDLTPVFVKDFHEPAHMRALEVMGQVYVHVDRGVDMLEAVCTVEDDYRVLDPFDPDFLYIDVPVVCETLDVNHGETSS